MTKYFVVFTEESTKDYGYYEDADSVSTSYSETVGHEVEEA